MKLNKRYTPRTDACAWAHWPGMTLAAEFARTLEVEVQEAEKEASNLREEIRDSRVKCLCIRKRLRSRLRIKMKKPSGFDEWYNLYGIMNEGWVANGCPVALGVIRRIALRAYKRGMVEQLRKMKDGG